MQSFEYMPGPSDELISNNLFKFAKGINHTKSSEELETIIKKIVSERGEFSLAGYSMYGHKQVTDKLIEALK
jgi:hypothetical protein